MSLINFNKNPKL